ncbi:cell division protein FtsQ/DivIB [Tengunoibacter tsumagoiensis]|uniref:POTRA domain-containing protein n=1 Tax=Tengunoibacter tsumagoiensis TaxID=2014871 RepID=A0A402A5M1_9CHLR|nr:FtsQ-type POTRA domain-containing protein [Tengunoibacter tsumagoiensis]GCE14400.1 hypothetical protein KTT_42590 [Tengunoibacter tsumagoiensis]
MTGKRKVPEQVALYSVRRGSEEESAPREQRRRVSQALQPPRSLPRVVKVPAEDPSTAWQTFAQRQEKQRQVRASSRKPPVKLVHRTFAKTGVPASSGRISPLRRRLPYYQTPVPERGGHQRRRGLLWRILSILALVIVVVLIALIPLTSAAFQIGPIRIEGTQNEALIRTIQQIGQQASIHGQNIFLYDVAPMRKQIASSPLIASVTVSKQWPNQLTVSVTERSPVLLWQTPQGTYSIDRQGMVIAAVQSAGTSLPIVVQTPLEGQKVQVGVYLDQRSISFAMEISKRMPQVVNINAFTLKFDGTMYASTDAQGAGPVAGRIGSRGSYIVESPTGWKAMLGGAYDANSLDNRLVELREILGLAQKQQLALSTIDLRYGFRPIFTVQQ